MFEKEAEEYANENYETCLYDDLPYANDSRAREQSFKDGVEFGYNKANEWNYPSKGEYPKENKRYLCKIKAFVGGSISYECFDYDTEYSSWKDAYGDVIAWKEIGVPELKESE